LLATRYLTGRSERLSLSQIKPPLDPFNAIGDTIDSSG
jgi:hypothetical protein